MEEKPLPKAPKLIPADELIEVSKAIEKLRHGRYDPKAAEVEQQVRAEFQKRRALEEGGGQIEVEES